VKIADPGFSAGRGDKYESLRIGSYPGLYCWFDFVLKMLNEFGFDAPELKTDLFLDENKIIQIDVPPG